MKVFLLTVLGLLSVLPQTAHAGEGADISMDIRINDQSGSLMVRPSEEIRVNFMATNEGPNSVAFLNGSTAALIANFSFPFDIDCLDLSVAQARGFDPTDYLMSWRIAPIAPGETRECRFTLRALSSASDEERLRIRYGPTNLKDPDPTDDQASFLITFDRGLPEPIPVPALSWKALAFLILGLFLLSAITVRVRAMR